MVHIIPDHKESDQAIVDLPLRNEITARLQQRWQHIEAVGAIEQITLHYLAGKLVVDVDFPLSIVQNVTEAQDLSQRLVELAIDEDIHTINIYFRSNIARTTRIFKVGELGKLIVGN